MKRAAWNIRYHSLVGLEALIVYHSDPGLKGVRGRVVRETKRTLLLELPSDRLITVTKEHGFFRLRLPGGAYVDLRGEEIRGTQPDRLRRFERGKGVVGLGRARKERRRARR